MSARAAWLADLFHVLARTEFRLRDQGTIAGFLWTLAYPAVVFAILYALFTRWMTPLVGNYAAALLIGIVQWNYFMTGTSAGLTSLRRKAGLIAGYSFPRLLVVLSSVAAVLLSHLLEWAVLLPVLSGLGVRPSAAWLALPLLIAAETLLIAAVACPLAALSVQVRDLDHLWSLALYALFFLTPVFYMPEILDAAGRRLVAVNPLAALIAATRAVVIDGRGPAAWTAAALLLGAAALAAASAASFGPMSRGVEERL